MTEPSSRPSSPIVVAEIGSAHGGDLERGLDLVDASADAGADIAKLQVVFASEILPPEAGLVPLPGGNTPLYDVFRGLERPVDFYAALAERAEHRDMGFLASPFGEQSVRLLEEIGVQAWKVASPELNHEPLLAELSQTGLPIILSTGISTDGDIRRAVRLIAEMGGTSPRRDSDMAASGYPLLLLHCVTSYPAPENEANLLLIPALAATYGLPTGLSDHSLDPVLLPALAASLGAVLIEKHITLNRNAGALDDPIALSPEDFARMTKAIRRHALPPSAGNNINRDEEKSQTGMSESGRPPNSAHLENVISLLSSQYNPERLNSCLGDGIKRLAASELPNYHSTKRSLHAVGALPAGTRLTPKNTAILRTEKLLRVGIEPRYRSQVYGKKLIRDVFAGDGITREDIPSPFVSDQQLRAALDSMILSASGWRKIFAPGGENSMDPFPDEVDRLLALGMGVAWGRWLTEHGKSKGLILVATDTRPSGGILAKMVIAGLYSEGLKSIYPGICAAPEAMARAAADKSIAAFAYVSASHNPAGYNGIKFGLGAGVIAGEDAQSLITLYRALVAEHGAAERFTAIMREEAGEPLIPDSKEKKHTLKAYTAFLNQSAAGLDSPDSPTLDALKHSLIAHPITIVADLNGSARCHSADRSYLEGLGVKLITFNHLPGSIVHAILPEGTALEPCRLALEKAHETDSTAIIGYVPDNDGDRGNLVIWDDSLKAARVLEAQEVFALSVLAELACAQWSVSDNLSATASQAIGKSALVVNGPTSHRVREIARIYGTEVYETEVGEANVVNRAAELRLEGYAVRILGEGSNGGTIIHPSRVRDPMSTITALLKLLCLPAQPGRDAPFADWCARIGRSNGACDGFGIGDILAALPPFTTTPTSAKEARITIKCSNQGVLKDKWEEIFAREWLLNSQKLQKAYGFCDWIERNNEGTMSRIGVGSKMRSTRSGGLKVVFYNQDGRDAGFLWMRNSGTEALFRVIAEIRGHNPEAEKALLAWHRGMVVEADRLARKLEGESGLENPLFIPPPFVSSAQHRYPERSL